MVLMHMMYKTNPEELIVAHFDHGIRSNSAEDYAFVKREAEKLNLKFVGMHANLGLNCSEDKARAMRYEFLQKCATEYNGEIYTAHHADDAIESITINILRGTGWRGLAPMRCVNLACRYAYGSERCNGKRALFAATSGCGLERCERRRCAGVRRLVCHLLVAPVVHFNDGVHHRHALDAVLQFVVEHRACIVQSLVVDTDRNNEVAEKQFGNVFAPRHLLASLE